MWIVRIYRWRWQYHTPNHVTEPWRPKIGRGDDEFGNQSVYLAGPWGLFVVFYGRVKRGMPS